MLPELENPWILQSSETIVRNPWFHLRRDQVHHRLSGPGQYWVIEARPALGVVAVDDGGRIVLVGQFRYPLGHSSWELPEGGGEADEGLLETAMRELKEETGLIATRWTRLGHVHTSNCFSDETGTIFLAEGLQTGDAAPDPTEVLQLKTIALKDLLAKHPERVIEIAVKGMLPKNPLGRAMYRKLKVYGGSEHPHAAQQPIALDI